MRAAGLAVLTAVLTLACGRDAIPRVGDGLDVRGLPEDVQRDYAVFANRCSKCHSLSRPLAIASREDSDEFWARYVERMRRQPQSGISATDGVAVQRFLHFYSRAERAKREPDAGNPLDGGQ